MNRSKALQTVFWSLVGGFVSYLGFRWLRLSSTFDLTDLPNQRRLIADLSDQIIPKTNSPSASECLTHDFVIKMIRDCTDTKTQKNFLSGLSDVENYCHAQFKRSFIRCDENQKYQVMKHMEAADKTLFFSKVKKRFLGKSFFSTLKEYTVIGYFTSEQGATQALRYSPIPAAYIACEPYVKGTKAWATN